MAEKCCDHECHKGKGCSCDCCKEPCLYCRILTLARQFREAGVSADLAHELAVTLVLDLSVGGRRES